MSKVVENNSQGMEGKDTHEPKYTFGNVTIFVSNIVLLLLNSYCYIGLLRDIWGRWNYLVVALSVVLLILNFVFFFKRRNGWLKVDLVVIILATIFTWGYYLFVIFDLIKYLQNPQELQDLIQSAGIWACLVYILVQFLQVTFIPIPAMVTTLAGTVLFGPGLATILSLIGIMLGSITAFVIGDKLGEKVVKWIVGEKNVEKYGSMLYDKGKYMFFLMMLFPIFPDDMLCLVAGMTTMSYKFFITTIILTRPIGIIMTCYLGSGTIIPYTETWGLIVWAIIVLFIVTAFWVAYKYKNQIENLVNKLSVKFRDGMQRFGNACKIKWQDFIALFSKKYRAKLLLERNKLPYLLLNEGVEDTTQKTKKDKKANK